jgi:hypothetical protein
MGPQTVLPRRNTGQIVLEAEQSQAPAMRSAARRRWHDPFFLFPYWETMEKGSSAGTGDARLAPMARGSRETQT